MDAAVAIALVSLTISGASLLVAWAAYKLHRDAPVKAHQRQVRADVLADAEKLRAAIQESGAQSKFRRPVDLNQKPGWTVIEWSNAKITRFTDLTLPATISQHSMPIFKWETAAEDYQRAQARLVDAVALARRASSGTNAEGQVPGWITEGRDEAKLALATAGSELRSRCDEALPAVEEIIKTIHRLDKSPD